MLTGTADHSNLGKGGGQRIDLKFPGFLQTDGIRLVIAQDVENEFLPQIPMIGSIYQSILFPNAAISHGFHGVILTLKSGASVAGYITSETDEAVTIRLPGGVSQKISSKDVAGREDMPQSLMPPGLAAASLKKEELADLVAYLQSLK